MSAAPIHVLQLCFGLSIIDAVDLPMEFVLLVIVFIKMMVCLHGMNLTSFGVFAISDFDRSGKTAIVIMSYLLKTYTLTKAGHIKGFSSAEFYH